MPPRAGGSICCLQRAMTPVSHPIFGRISHIDRRRVFRTADEFECPSYARAGIGMGRASSVWKACRSTEQLLPIPRRLACLFAIERSIYSDLQ